MPEYKLVLSHRAKNDIKDIYAYTLQTYGKKQAIKYLDKIESAFNMLRANPEIGRERPDIKAGYHSLTTEKHVCFYKITESGIYILGLLHGRMDVLNHIGNIKD